jgi:hypothetical protein
MNRWWNKYFTAIMVDFEAMQAEWNMLKIFFKWMLSGKIVEKPGLELKYVSWGVACDAHFKADVENWVPDDGMARQSSAAGFTGQSLFVHILTTEAEVCWDINSIKEGVQRRDGITE